MQTDQMPATRTFVADAKSCTEYDRYGKAEAIASLRAKCDADWFLKAALGIIAKGLTYLELMHGKGGGDLLPA